MAAGWSVGVLVGRVQGGCGGMDKVGRRGWRRHDELGGGRP